MARYPRATWRGPVPGYTPGGMGAIRGLVLHIQEGIESGTDAWFHNPASRVSAHFGNPKAGGLDQWVDTADMAWAEVAGNPNWISIENEGNSGDQLTASQLENTAELLAWLHSEYGVPLQISDTPLSNTPGLTGHGLGGSAWGGHYDCPGTPILAQRQAIITRAAQIAGAPTPGGTMGTIPASIGQKWPDIAGEFPANGQFDDDTALIYADAGARAAALYAKQARDAVTALAAKVQAPPPVDVKALAAALQPLLTAGATADQIATAVVSHLATSLTAGS